MRDRNIREDRILGALFGFAIGDAMGATAEFMTQQEIKEEYGEIRDILGGGWLDLEPGKVTDDTQMSICIMNVLEYVCQRNDYGPDLEKSIDGLFEAKLMENFVEWYRTDPKDIGNQCRKILSKVDKCPRYRMGLDPSALGNGSLMRALPIALLGDCWIELNLIQSRMTHNNEVCDAAIRYYSKMINDLVYRNIDPLNKNLTQAISEPTGHVINTLINAECWATKDSFEECMISAVNHGGDADTIAAITGSLAGAKYGFSNIPERWVKQLDEDIKNKLKNFYKIVYKGI